MAARSAELLVIDSSTQRVTRHRLIRRCRSHPSAHLRGEIGRARLGNGWKKWARHLVPSCPDFRCSPRRAGECLPPALGGWRGRVCVRCGTALLPHARNAQAHNRHSKPRTPAVYPWMHPKYFSWTLGCLEPPGSAANHPGPAPPSASAPDRSRPARERHTHAKSRSARLIGRICRCARSDGS
jgi:hypothetical protein